MYKENLKQEHFDSETLKYILTLDKVKCNKSLDTVKIPGYTKNSGIIYNFKVNVPRLKYNSFWRVQKYKF